MSVPGISRWLAILEATAQILIIPPYFENLGKRLVKSPKVYIADSGLACHLLGIGTRAELVRSPFRGALFEGFVAAKIAKAQLNAGKRREIYYFRDQQGLEVDFVVPLKAGNLRLLEAKSTSTPMPDMANSMLRLAKAWRAGARKDSAVSMFIVHEPRSHDGGSRALAPGVQAMPWTEFCVSELP